MTTFSAKAYAPAHITGFFEIHDRAENLRACGSCGAGICLSEGVRCEVELRAADRTSIQIRLNGKPASASVIRLVIERLIADRPFDIVLYAHSKLPSAQGFGISGAGALATALALDAALGSGLSHEEIVGLAHEAEVACRTGLGDIVAQALGGVTLSTKPGAAPYGVVRNIPGEAELVVGVLGVDIHTRDILRHREFRVKINQFGHSALDKMLKAPTLQNLFELSWEFAIRTGLADAKMLKVLERLNALGSASQCMLGNSVFAVGDTHGLVELLSEYGPTWVVGVGDGARVL